MRQAPTLRVVAALACVLCGCNTAPGGRGAAGVVAVRNGLPCVATLVGPRAALTAAHCISAPAWPTQVLTEAPAATYRATSVATHPGYRGPVDPEHDLALVCVARDVAGASPVALASRVPRVGEGVTLIGFGIAGGVAVPGNRRRSGSTEVASVTARTFTSDHGAGRAVACPGDSGAPVLDGRGELLGVHVAGTEPCTARTGSGTYVRVDASRGWIMERMRTCR